MVIVRNVICFIGLVIILPLLGVAAILIFIEDGFPIFFKQKRIGLHKEKFTIYKIRTLKKNAPQVGTHEIKEHHKLNMGRAIRALKLDEFPQLFNVIKGDLNLVGPRPGLESQLALEEARMFQGIFETKPGITGLAQVLGYDMSTPEMLAEVDKLYIDNKSPKLNIIIFLATFFKYPRTYLASILSISNLKNI
ncbi:sugar transferase [Gammaproteobacteria bacterium]|jgi:O-antigen biosynthesis protein WbqP|nr:sugar transferase [Gammaproteobacteria bacterium]